MGGLSPEGRKFLETQDRARIVSDGGKWYMRPYAAGPKAEIPERMAKVAQGALRITRDSKAPGHERRENIWRGINCHRAAFYAAGFIDRDDPHKGTVDHPHYDFSFFPFQSFEHFDTLDALEDFIRRKIGGSLGVIQIVGYQAPDKRIVWKSTPGANPHLAHTLLAKVADDNSIICFDKLEYGPDFRVADISEVFDSPYGPLGYWNACTVDEARGSETARNMREELNSEKARRSLSPESR